MSEPLLRVKNLVKQFPIKGGLLSREVARVHAIDGVSFDLAQGETLGLVGESGCGKSTTGRLLVQLPPPTSGQVVYDGIDLATLKGEKLRATRTKRQMIFPDPHSSRNPPRRIQELRPEGLRNHSTGSCPAL